MSYMLELPLVAAVFAGLGGLVSLVCWNVRRSRCKSITTPCCVVQRELMTLDEAEIDVCAFG